MMIHAVLGNPNHPEYGVATIPFPIPHDQYAHCMELLEALEIGDAVKADCQVQEINSFYSVLKHTEKFTVNVEELNYLAKRLDGFDMGEATQFQAMAHKLELSELKDLINLTFCCQEATVITDFSDLAAVGRDHYMNLHGGCATVTELEALDGEETARQLKCEEFDDEYLAIELDLADKYFSPLHAKAIKALLLKRAQRGNVRRAANYYKLIRYSFSGAGKSFGGKPCNIRNFFADIWRCSHRLENVVIENKDFESLLAQYDRPDAFFYCDPPYYNAECYEVEFPKRDHLRLCSAIKRCRGFAMVSYNFCFEIMDIYKDFYIFRTKRPNSMSQTAGSEYEEVIITNFDPLLCTSQLSIFTKNSDMGVELVHEPELPCGLTEDGKIIFNKDTEESQ